ncbi:MAG TPA: transaldolase [Terriglobales bacterium]
MKIVSDLELGSTSKPAAGVRPAELFRQVVRSVSELKIKLFADGADLAQILAARRNPLIQGFTTNPTLMRAAGVKDYEAFAHEVLAAIPDRPISFEVFADEFSEMERQARKIAGWADNVYVKIPITNTERISSLDLAHRLAHSEVKVNVTAVLTLDQVRDAAAALRDGAPAVISVFAGRIADTGRDPIPLMAAAVEIVSMYPNVELLWASPRELLNIFQANDIGCDIITATDSVLGKLKVVGKDLHDYSLDTVQMFFNDASRSGYQL